MKQYPRRPCSKEVTRRAGSGQELEDKKFTYELIIHMHCCCTTPLQINLHYRPKYFRCHWRDDWGAEEVGHVSFRIYGSIFTYTEKDTGD